MTQNVKDFLQVLKKRDYRQLRREMEMDVTEETAGKNPYETDAILFRTMLEQESPLILEHDTMGFNRTLRSVPFYCDSNGNRASSDVKRGNLIPDYGFALQKGFDAILTDVEKMLEERGESDFYESVIMVLRAALDFADRYREEARQKGNTRLYHALCHIPHGKPTSFYEACVFMKFLLFTLRCNRNIHITLGRFDQYMYPFFEADLKAGVPEESLFETLEEFFISINFDLDIYFGVQQGDSGQSMVLGGYSVSGEDMYNRLSQLCIEASLELNLIDPKINLRTSNRTPIQRLEFATTLTRQGLGFPQYCNDDVVVPGLIALGYAPEDAYNYGVAACWEYLVSGNAMDIPNMFTMNFPMVVETALRQELKNCPSFDAFLDKVKEGIRKECDHLMEMAKGREKDGEFTQKSPYLSVFVGACLERGKDVSEGGAVYNNYGFHGAGISTAADSLAAVRKAVYEEKICTAEELLEALADNFEHHAELRNQLLSYPKMGNNDDYVDSLASELMGAYSEYLNGKPNSVGGIFRAGTGSAMEYLFSAARVGATPDGRKAGQPYGSSFSPAITTKLEGPMSCIQSFTKFDMSKIINGGPLTMEIHDTVFRNEDGVRKVAQLVKGFIDLGGHQLQLNSINRDRLLDAQKHPEDHQNLLVRVWGWSGYFNELDKAYQDHIIQRTEFMC